MYNISVSSPLEQRMAAVCDTTYFYGDRLYSSPGLWVCDMSMCDVVQCINGVVCGCLHWTLLVATHITDTDIDTV